MEKKKRIVIALGGNALGNTLPEQMKAVKITSRAIVDLIQEGCEVVVAHGNGPQVGMVNNAMIALTHEDLHGLHEGVDLLNKSSAPEGWTTNSIAHGSHCAGVIAGSDSPRGIRGFAPDRKSVV